MIHDPITSTTCLLMEALSITSRPRKRESDDIIGEPMPPGRRLTGVDVSKWQGEVNWRRVAEDHTFAIVKATEGVGYVDPKFQENVALAGAKWGDDGPLILGAYHFGTWHNADRKRPEIDARQEADHYLTTLDHVGWKYTGNLPPVLDLEWDSREDKSKRMGAQTIIAWAMEWLRWVEAETGVVPMVYTGPNFIQRLGNPKALHRYPLWMARYTRRREPTRQIPGWPWTIWQHTGRGRTNGVRGNVDLNRFAGSVDDLARWTR